MSRHFCLTLLVSASLLGSLPARADAVDDLVAALELPKLFSILATEGQQFGDDLADDMFPDASRSRWSGIVAQIHTPDRMEQSTVTGLRAALEADPAALDAMVRYFTEPAGQRIIRLEVAAREALLDEDLRDLARARYAELAPDQRPPLPQIDALIIANDLIEQNVAGGMNSNLAFYRGMIAGGAVEEVPAESDLMTDIWSQEPQIRTDTVEWMMPFMVLAYSPLTEDELQSYIDFSLTPAGRQLNSALFAAFNATYERLSYDLGAAAARFMQEQEL